MGSLRLLINGEWDFGWSEDEIQTQSSRLDE